MTWHRLATRPLRHVRAITLRRYIRTQPIYEQQAHNEEDVPHKQPPGFGLATPRQVVFQRQLKTNFLTQRLSASGIFE